MVNMSEITNDATVLELVHAIDKEPFMDDDVTWYDSDVTYDCISTKETTLKDMSKCTIWSPKNWIYSHTNTKHKQYELRCILWS